MKDVQPCWMLMVIHDQRIGGSIQSFNYRLISFGLDLTTEMHQQVFQTFPPKMTIIGQDKSGEPQDSLCIQKAPGSSETVGIM